MAYAETIMGKTFVTGRILSDTICAKPGITPKDLSEQLAFPLPETMGHLQMLLRNKRVEWSGGATDPIMPAHEDPAIQLQMIISVTGIDVDRPL